MSAHAVVVGRGGELAAEITDSIIIEGDSQFQFDGRATLTVAEIPDAFTQNGIYHRSDFILCAPYGIVVCHLTIFAFCRLSKSSQNSACSSSLKVFEAISLRISSNSCIFVTCRSGATSIW